MASDLPDGVRPEAARPERGWRRHAGLLPLAILGALLALALAGLFGGTTTDWRRADTDAAALEVQVPRTLRSGLIFEFRVRITPRRPVQDLRLAVSQSLMRDLTINTDIPAASEEEAQDGEFRFAYGPAAAGETLEIKIDGQVNPSLFGGTEGRFAALDGDAELAALPLAIRVLP